MNAAVPVALLAAVALMTTAVRLYPGTAMLVFASVRREPGRFILGVCGVALSAALLVVSAVMSDTVAESVRSRAQPQGPIDVLVLARTSTDRNALDSLPASIGLESSSVLRMTATTASVSAVGFVAFEEPQAQILEVEFEQARVFASDPMANGVTGVTPAAGDAVANADLAVRLNLRIGSRVQMYAYGVATPLRVTAILPKRGIAGLLSIDGPASSRTPNLFVAPGTLERAWAADPTNGAAPVSVLAVAGHDERVVDALRAATAGSSIEVRALQREAAAQAARQSDQLRTAARPYLAAGVTTGVVLLVLTVVVAVERRRRMFAELRALGRDRRGVIALIGVESGANALFGALGGGALGVALAGLGAVAAEKTYAPENAPAVLLLRFTVSGSSVLIAAAVAALLGVLVGTVAGAAATRGSIAAALAGQPRPSRLRASRLAALVGRSSTTEIAFAFARARPVRTATLAMMFAITICSVTVLITVSRSQADAGIASITDLGGGAALIVTNNAANALRPEQLATQPDVVWTVPAPTRSTRLDVGAFSTPVTIVAPEPEFATRAPPALVARAPALPDDATAWRMALTGTGGVILGADLAADMAGLNGHSTRPGDIVMVTDEATGRERAVTVLGVVRQAQFAGVDHVYGSGALIEQLAARTVGPNLIYVGSRPGSDNERLAAEIIRRHPREVVDAVSFDAMAGDRLRQRQDFLNLLIGYSAVSLLAGMVGSGLVCAASVRERGRDLGVLRAIGADDYRVRKILRVEATGIASSGTLLGILAGLGLARWTLAGAAPGVDGSMAVPWLPLLVVALFTLAAARSAVWVATTVSLGVEPATALRQAAS